MKKRLLKKENKNRLKYLVDYIEKTLKVKGKWKEDGSWFLLYKTLIIGVFGENSLYLGNRNRVVIEYLDLFDKWAEWRNYYSKLLNDISIQELIEDIAELTNDNLSYHYAKSMVREKFDQKDELSKAEYLEIYSNNLKEKKDVEDVIDQFELWLKLQPKVTKVTRRVKKDSVLNFDIYHESFHNDNEFYDFINFLENEKNKIESQTPLLIELSTPIIFSNLDWSPFPNKQIINRSQRIKAE